jgi:hypothetical protein
VEGKSREMSIQNGNDKRSRISIYFKFEKAIYDKHSFRADKSFSKIRLTLESY